MWVAPEMDAADPRGRLCGASNCTPMTLIAAITRSDTIFRVSTVGRFKRIADIYRCVY